MIISIFPVVPKKKMDAIESVNGARADVVQSITSD